MCPFIETICIRDGVACNIEYHNKRLNQTRTAFQKNVKLLDLADYIHPETVKGIMKCRVLYNEDIEEITYTSYKIRPVNTLKLVFSDTIDYTYKSADREEINRLFGRRGEQDEILIIKRGRVTDTSIANIAFFDGNEWHTPETPLLNGTRRMNLLDSGILVEKEIMWEQLFAYSKITLFNAMIDFGHIMIPVDKQHILE